MPPSASRRSSADQSHKPRWMITEEPEVIQEEKPDSVRVVEFAEEVDYPSVPGKCVVRGLTSGRICPKQTHKFTIEAVNGKGERQRKGGDAFFVNIRGAVRARARVIDDDDGHYTVYWRPDVSGPYSLSVSLFGISLAGSPFSINVEDPAPFPSRCEVRGEALHRITARLPSSFEIRYRDRAGNVAQAVDVDVFVVPIQEMEGGSSVEHSAWDVATQAPEKESRQTAARKLTDEERMESMSYASRKKRTPNSKGKRDKSDDGRGTPTSPIEETPVTSKGKVKRDKLSEPDSSRTPTGGETQQESSRVWSSIASEQDGYGSADEELISLADKVSKRKRAIPIQVLGKALMVFADSHIRGGPVATLQAEQLATVIEERISQDGQDVRACVVFEEVRPDSLNSPRSHAAPREALRGTNTFTSTPPKEPTGAELLMTASARSTLVALGAGPETPHAHHSASKVQMQESLHDTEIESKMQKVEASRPGLRTPLGQTPRPGVLPRTLTGWVYIKRHNRKLVTSRVRLEPWVRQQASLLWKLQQLNDRLQRHLQTEAAMLDPTGVGFAFGGVHPGHLHSKGQLLEAHKISYSVDRVGKYLLHVRLRNHAKPVAGSPFALTVLPGMAHETTTRVLLETQPLVGEVGLGPSDGCQLTLATNDRVGNICNEGGGQVVTTTSLGDKMTTTCTDNGDGTYSFTWKSKMTGMVDVKILINKNNIRGSPFKLQLVSSIPEIPRTVIEGEGLQNAVAGIGAPIRLKLVDQYGNPCRPGREWSVGLAITNSKKKIFDMTPHPDVTRRWTSTIGELIVEYVANQAGNTDMHLWCEPVSGDVHARASFPGSPFTLHVTAGEPTAAASYVDGWTLAAVMHTKSKAAKGAAPSLKEIADAQAAEAAAMKMITAGDTVSVRAHGVDQFGNSAHVENSWLKATVIAPDGSEIEKEVVDATMRRASAKDQAVTDKGASIMYEIRHETIMAGHYKMHVKLHGESVMNSPITFDVEPSIPVPQQSKLILPDDPESLVADLDKPSIVMFKSVDKFGNACTSGGLRIQGRLTLVKQSASDNTILMPNNHSVTVNDLNNGLYEVNVAVMMTATVRLIVNMDKDLPGATGELPPCQLTFLKAGATAPAMEEPAKDEKERKERKDEKLEREDKAAEKAEG